MKETEKPRKLAGCIAGSCPAVYEDNDTYLILGTQTDGDQAPQTVADDEAAVRIDKEIIAEATL